MSNLLLSNYFDKNECDINEMSYYDSIKHCREVKENGFCNTCEMDIACKNGDLQKAKSLYESGKKCSKYAMIYSHKKGHLNIIKYLEELGHSQIVEYIISKMKKFEMFEHFGLELLNEAFKKNDKTIYNILRSYKGNYNQESLAYKGNCDQESLVYKELLYNIENDNIELANDILNRFSNFEMSDTSSENIIDVLDEIDNIKEEIKSLKMLLMATMKIVYKNNKNNKGI